MRVNVVMSSALLLMSAFSLSGCGNGAEPDAGNARESIRPAKIVTVQPSGINVIRTYPGILDASKKSELAFRVGGELVELPAQSGMVVRKGDMVARLDDSEYKNILDEREARYELAKIQYEQASKLVKQKLGSQLQLDQAQAERKSAKAAMEVARDNLGYTKLLAPFDGVIAQVSVENYQAIEHKTPIIQLQQDDILDVDISIPESMIKQLIRPGDPEIIKAFCGEVRFTNHPGKSYKACYKEHESIPDALTRNYALVFSLQPITDFAALPGMTVSMTLDFSPFAVDSEIEGVLVPIEAVFEQDGKEWVWVVSEDMRAQLTEVSTTEFVGEMIAVSKGLNPGQPIIAAGVSYVLEGMPVRPVVKERGL